MGIAEPKMLSSGFFSLQCKALASVHESARLWIIIKNFSQLQVLHLQKFGQGLELLELTLLL